ncbi:MAG: dockerin type I domain-containing protein, partial [Gemmatimonadota bacterium]|nr:dockerin type I domain-containing protein [Gemmatimonadota bacterium]
FSPDGTILANGSEDGTILLWGLAPESPRLAADVNGDGQVNIRDLAAVAAALGQAGENAADVNGDGQVNIRDLAAVAAALGEVAAAPAALRQQGAAHLTQEEVQHYLTQAQQANLTDATSVRGIRFLKQLLAAFTPKETALLPNYPNPFNPETWIPYQLAKPADVILTIYDIQGRVVRDLDLGHQRAGMYQSKSRAAYWDGRNAVGEPVASGVYFYTLTAGDFTATRKLLIRK